MTKIRLLRTQTMHTYFQEICSNLDKYRSGNFNELLSDPTTYIEIDRQFDEDSISKIDCDTKDHKEVECCILLYKTLDKINPYIARDPRMWTYFTHTFLLEYSRKRWPIPADDEMAVEHISRHFFANGARGIERDNAASRLWWMAKVCSGVTGLSMQDALTTFLYKSDVRANILERPTTAQNPSIMTSIIKKLHESYNGDKALFTRPKFRPVMKEVNLQGGVKLLAILGETEINRIVDESAMK